MIKSCVILAAGLGLRMRPLTDHIPKPMVEIAGRPIISYILDMVIGAGCDNIVMNIHYKPEPLREYIAQNYSDKVVFSDETDRLLNSGGGVFKALDYIQNESFFVINADCIWSSSVNALKQLVDFYDPNTMDILKLLSPAKTAIGFDEKDIYGLSDDNKILRDGKTTQDLSYTGIQILKKSFFQGYSYEPFSVREIWDKAFEAETIYGCVFQGQWLHIGTPYAVNDAAHFLKM
ncbi:MAG: nucleotidyltransferase family protein [Pseudomonadota bacterium]